MDTFDYVVKVNDVTEVQAFLHILILSLVSDKR